MKKSRFLNIIFCILIHFSLFSFANGGDVIKIATIQFSPLGVVNEKTLDKSGAFYDISNEIITLAGLNFSNEIMPYTRAESEIEKGNVDVSIFSSPKKIDASAIRVCKLLDMEMMVIR